MSDAPASRARVGLISLGCAKNLVDSEIMLGELRRQGHEIVADLDEAEMVVVNTCAFIDEAKRESIDAILEVAARKGPGGGVRKLLVAGCMVNRYGPELAREIPEIDGFVGLDQLREVGTIVQIGGDAPPPAPSHLVFDHTAPRLLTTRGHAYLKVAEGCDNPCTFCAIPSWRGRFRSRTIASLVAEARELEAAGITELCLIAQDTTRYGEDLGLGRHGLLRLVEALLAGTSFPWIRFLYAYPTTLDPELLRLMGSEERLCAYLDIPLQHSHPEILSAMRRGGSADRYLRLLDQARELVPGIHLRSTFIVGFPGETEEQFAHLLDFVARARFDHLGAFVFSAEEGTPAAALSDPVPKAVARRRYRQLLRAQRPIALASRRALVGRRLPVLVEGTCEESEHLLQGRHQGMAPEIDGRILINDGVAPAGRLALAEITEAHPSDLVARIVAPAAGVA
ncbi:MAG: 30S ribosomal protein S12 methylthiotransferase RimO [Thermoanaerobaculia bacterium]|nr:30S ribosomal protein S12 methylthiotransferase RimO [Thermoanaerobaculia bacterium]MBP7812063.1 30S ribosomal protein S12 methylthiotransferase RimO [Thermoanaerobaculia bacterium]MBP8844838.1 30S ribosomal protein S12 methylthiotransferase RimO [Thermoanaerobaculia bacterium]HPA96603.1 30S ribosomal protein S12 methylthiotransferase RimO [Thermoanaerobaculia bacterium]HQN37907.1 30S ribosomal protein S12 methylthiotransferase RimO [Thermoanaerobaculia bacterium]